MSNFEVYKKTLSFSFLMFLFDFLSLGIIVGTSTAGFIIFNSSTDKALIGLVIGLVLGIIIAVLIGIFVTNRIKAAQIAMMTYGVVDNKLPDDTFHAGFEAVRGRLGSITAFFVITGLIKSAFRQIGRGVERIGRAVGGDVGGNVTSAINSAIEILIGYLCDCCLGWILYRKDVNAFKAGCEGAVIFFKHGKTLIKNVARIFGMGALSLVVIGGAFAGLLYVIFLQFPQMFNDLAKEIVEMNTRIEGNIPSFFMEPSTLTIAVSVIAGIVIWAMIHNILIRPFILVGVLRNFMAAGLNDIPTEADFAELEKKSPKFAKLHSKIE